MVNHCLIIFSLFGKIEPEKIVEFMTETISYVPWEKMVESKSLKLYLFSFRNHGDFHEDCVMYLPSKNLVSGTLWA